MNIKIAVAYHKPADIIKSDVYLPIQVGKSINPQLDLGIQPDNEGDNISDENDYYCELTAIYWIWKNLQADYKGLFHYRRFLTIENPIKHQIISSISGGRICTSLIPCNGTRFVKDAKAFENALPKLLLKYDILTTKRIKVDMSTERFFNFDFEYWRLIRKIISEHHKTYITAFEETISSHSFFFANMFVMKNTLFEEYCDFLFSILEELKGKLIKDKWLINLHAEKLFSRKLGYIAEVLTGVFFTHQKMSGTKIKELRVNFLNE